MIQQLALLLTALFTLTLHAGYQKIDRQVTIGSGSIQASASVSLQIEGGTFLLDRMTETERDAIPTPAVYSMLVNTTSGQVEYWTGAAWTGIAGGITTPAVTVDNHVPRWDGTDGSVLQDSNLSLDDNGDMMLNGAYAGLRTFNVYNSSSATANVVGATLRVTGDQSYWGLLGMTNSGSTIFGGAYNGSLHLYSQGYNDNLYTVDGNKSHVWASDISDSHNYSFSEIMELEADGDLIVSKSVSSPAFHGNVGDATWDGGASTVKNTFEASLNSGVVDDTTISDDGGLDISWGVTRIYDHVTNKIVAITAGSDTCTDNAINYLYWSTGTTLTLSNTEPSDDGTEVPIARIGCQAGDIWAIRKAPLLSEFNVSTFQGFTHVFPQIVVSGLIVTEDTDVTNTWDVSMTSGHLHTSVTLGSMPAAIDSRTTNLVRHYHSGGAWTTTTDAEIDTTQYDNGTELTAVTNSKYYRSLFFLAQNKIHWVYPTTEYSTLTKAIRGSNPTMPPGLELAPKLMAVIIKGNDVAFPTAGGDRWIDQRPIIGANISGAAISDHQNLSNILGSTEGYHLSNAAYTEAIALLDSLTVSGTDVTFSSSVTATGNMTANAFYGDGSNLTGLVATFEGLTDTSISSAARHDFIQHDGTDWKNPAKPQGTTLLVQDRQFFHDGWAENTLASRWQASAGDFEVAASASALAGDTNAFVWTLPASASSTLRSQLITVPTSEVPIGYTFRYKYDGDDDDISVYMGNVTGSASHTAPVFLKSGTHRLEDYIPHGLADVTTQFIFVNNTTNSGKQLTINGVAVYDNPFKYVDPGEENNFSARIANNGTATITSQGGLNSAGQNAIASVTRTGSGAVTVTFTSGFFGVAPNVVVSVLSDSANRNAIVRSVSTSEANIYTTDVSTPTPEDRDFEIVITRQGADYKPIAEHVQTTAKAGSQILRYDGYTSGTTGGIKFTTRTYNKDSQLNDTSRLFSDDNTGSYTKVTAEQRIKARVRVVGGTASADIFWYIEHYNSSDVLQEESEVLNNAPNFTNGHSTTFFMAAGDYLFVKTQGNPPNQAAYEASFKVEAEPLEAEFTSAVPVAQTAVIEYNTNADSTALSTTATTAVTIPLNDIVVEKGFVSLSSSQVTIAAGTYLIKGNGDIQLIGSAALDFQARVQLYDITNSAIPAGGKGVSVYGYNATGNMERGSNSSFETEVTLLVPTVFELQAYTEVRSSGTAKIGNANDTAAKAKLIITKIK